MSSTCQINRIDYTCSEDQLATTLQVDQHILHALQKSPILHTFCSLDNFMLMHVTEVAI